MPFCDAATDRMRPTTRSRRTARSTDVVIEIEPKAPRSIGAIEPRRVDRTIVGRTRSTLKIAVGADVTPGGTARHNDAMSDWADDSGDLPPLSAGLPPPPTTTTTTTIPKPSTSVPAPQVASPQKSGYVPPHLRNRQAAAGDGGSRGFGASTTTKATRANDGDGDDEREFLIDRSRARDDARTRRAREGTHAIAISTAPHDGDGR